MPGPLPQGRAPPLRRLPARLTGAPLVARGCAGAEDALLQTVRRMGETMSGLAPEARKRRLVGWLQRRGHSWANIRHLLEQLDKEAAVRNVDDGWS